LTREEEEASLVRSNELIHRLTGAYARGYRSPSWDLSPHTVDLLIQHGFAYDSSMMGHDCLPYWCRRGDVITLDQLARLGTPTRLVEMPISWSLDDFPHFEYLRTQNYLQEGLKRAGDVLDNWVDDFRYMVRTVDWGVLTYTFHPQAIGRGHRMLLLERLIQALGEMGAIFVPMEAAVAEFVQRSPSG
jgi:peptidoglycan/xylan/chitin deacetylase (PgdA/CDA1 family)